jgi:GrpB-like predicted nucleotidyltransferase (UPF0157 family)
MKITIVDYDPDWPELFEIEKLRLMDVLLKIEINIEHIGSTSVEGLAAKPVIDILIGVNKFIHAEELVKPIINLGYQYISEFEDVMPYRKFFIKEDFQVRTHHVHMVETGTEFWNRHLGFRNYLRQNSDIRDAYGDLKKHLAKKEWKDGNEYASAKTEFIQSIEKLI